MQMNHNRDDELRDLKARAQGQWPSILTYCGVDADVLTRKNKACPLCRDGENRFTFDDKHGNGDYFCRKCGAGDGFSLLMKFHSIGFVEAKKRVAEALGVANLPRPTVRSPKQRKNMRELAQKIWSEGRPVQQGDEVSRYLRNRGLFLTEFPTTLRMHPSLGYFVTEGNVSKHVADYPAMLALVQDPDGGFVTVHRTYLKDGQKARGHDSKKLVSGGLKEGAIRLYEATHELGIAEGIETCLAVRQRNGQPIWAAVNCRNLKVLAVPDTVKSVYVYADNDADSHFDGQASAFNLARRLVNEAARKRLDRKVRVFVPQHDGQDWCDAITSQARFARAA
jgi:putative DNA primase/helicase